MQSKDFVQYIQGLIAQDEVKSALAELRTALANSPKLSEVLQQSGRWHNICEQIRLGKVDIHDATVIQNQIRYGLLQYLEALQDTQPEIARELAQAAVHIAQSKNVSTGNNTAGRDIRYGDNITYNYNNASIEIKHALTSPPFDPPYFIGRDADLKKLRQTLLDGNNLLLMVNGKGGMGKTSLASRYYRDYAHKYAHVAWVLSEKSIRNALLLLALPLGLDFRGMTYTNEQRLDQVLQALANLKRPCLLVIDNANEPDDLRQHFQALRRCHNFHLLLTTRINKFSEARFFPVQGLEEEYALQLFKKYYPEHSAAEDALLKNLIAAVDKNTLLIELFAKNLNVINEYETSYSLAQLLEDVQQNLLALSQSQSVHTAYQAKGTGIRHETPEAIVAAMYDVRALSEAERKVISIFALLPNEDIPYQYLKRLLENARFELKKEDKPTESSKKSWLNRLLKFSKLQKSDAPLTHTDFSESADQLAQKGWIDFNRANKTFKANQVVQDVVKAKQKARLLQDCGDLITALADELDKEEILHKDSYATAVLFAQYAESIVAALETPDFEVGRLYQNIGNFHSKTGDLVKALEAYEQFRTYLDMLFTSTPENITYKNGLAISYEKLGSTHSALGNLDKALVFFEDETQLFEELYEAYPQNVSFKNGLAISYSKLGGTHSALGNLDKTLVFFEQYNQLEKELYEAYPQNIEFKNNLAISYEKLGETQSALGNLNKALVFFEQYNQLEKELYEAYPQNVSFKYNLQISYEKLGDTTTTLGDLDNALGFYEEENRLIKELYEAYPQNVSFKNGLAVSYSMLGRFYRDHENNTEKARNYFEQCWQLWEELATAYPNYVEFSNNFNWAKNALEEL